VALCARCFASYLALLLSLIFFVYVDFKLPKKVLCALFLALCFPLLIDGITQYYALRESNNYLRLFTGLSAGIGVSIALIPFYIRVISGVVDKGFHTKILWR